ncbi:hypothetical protein TI03_05020, partial [Achromatium sp. WMS1]
PCNFDWEQLKATVADVRKVGNIEKHLTAAQKLASSEYKTCQDKLARLGRFTGTMDSILRLPLPESATLKQLAKEHSELSEELYTITHNIKELEKEKIRTEQMLKKLLRQHDVPTVAQLETARTDRDAHWQTIKYQYIEQTGVKRKVTKAGIFSENLLSSYESKVKDADALSDRLRINADQVARRMELESKIEDLQSRLKELDNTLQETQTKQRFWQTKWTTVWKPLKIEAGTPQEMDEWLFKMENLIRDTQVATKYANDKQNLAEEYNQLKQTIVKQIAQFDAHQQTQGMNLNALLTLCEQRITKEEKIKEKRRQIENEINKAIIDLKTNHDKLQAIDVELANWKLEWIKAVEGLSLKTDIHPELAMEMFDNLMAFFSEFDEAEALSQRIVRIDRVAEEFKEKVLSFITSIGWNKNLQDEIMIVSQLHKELDSARETRASLLQIEEQRKEIIAEIKDTLIKIKNATQQLAMLQA